MTGPTFETADHDFDAVDARMQPVLRSDTAEIWTSLRTRVRARAAEARVSADTYETWLDAGLDLLLDLEGALTDGPDAHRLGKFWHHRSATQIVGAEKVPGERIPRELLLDATARYLATPALEHPALDWILLDALVFAELSAFRDALRSGVAVGRPDWTYVLSGGDPQKSARLHLAKALMAVLFRYLLPLVGLWYLVDHHHRAIATLLAAIYGVALVRHIATTVRVRRHVRQGHAILASMVDAYQQLNPPVINPVVVRARLDAATAIGARFDGALFTVLDRVATRHGTTFLPFS